MANDESLFLKHYVYDVRKVPDGLLFVVYATESRQRYNVYRIQTEYVPKENIPWLQWSCDCGASATCDHIRRAIMYFANMQEFPESDQPVAPAIVVNPPRRIKVGE